MPRGGRLLSGEQNTTRHDRVPLALLSLSLLPLFHCPPDRSQAQPAAWQRPSAHMSRPAGRCSCKPLPQTRASTMPMTMQRTRAAEMSRRTGAHSASTSACPWRLGRRRRRRATRRPPRSTPTCAKSGALCAPSAATAAAACDSVAADPVGCRPAHPPAPPSHPLCTIHPLTPPQGRGQAAARRGERPRGRGGAPAAAARGRCAAPAARRGHLVQLPSSGRGRGSL